MNKPYVISADLETVDVEYLRFEGIDKFREELSSDLSSIGKDVEWVNYDKLKSGINKLVSRTNLPIISLEDRYLDTVDVDYYLGISRSIKEDLEDNGYDSRLGYRTINEQFNEVSEKFYGKEIVLADDVIFSGENACWVIDELSARNIKVAGFISGIAIGEAAEKLAMRDIDLEIVGYFDDVDDEVCERDFAIVHGSGRKIFGKEMSALYFDDMFGKPEQWASIDQEHVSNFCLSSLRRNLELLVVDQPLSVIGNFHGYSSELTIRQNIEDAINLRTQ